MTGLAQGARLFLACKPVNMRKVVDDGAGCASPRSIMWSVVRVPG